MIAPPATELAAAQTFHLPKPPGGDPAAARQLARALRTCALELLAAQSQAHAVLADTHQHWTGSSARAANHPLCELDARTAQVARVLREAADRFEDYAHVLDKAHEQHHWSLGKILTVAAVVVVTTAVVVVTVGVAAPAAAAADAAIVGAEVAATTAAVGTASAAAVEAAEAVTLAVRALQALRAVAAFLRPQIAVTAGLTDYEAFRQVHATGHLDLAALTTHAALDVGLGAGAGAAAGAVRPFARWLGPRAAAVLTAGTGTKVLPFGFADARSYGRFAGALHAGLAKAGFPGTTAAFQGSSVTGRSFVSGVAFDYGRVSDFDIALASEDLVHAAKTAGVRLRSGGLRTGPLDVATLRQLGLAELAQSLSELAGRDVHFMIYRSIDDAAARSPHLGVPRP